MVIAVTCTNSSSTSSSTTTTTTITDAVISSVVLNSAQTLHERQLGEAAEIAADVIAPGERTRVKVWKFRVWGSYWV